MHRKGVFSLAGVFLAVALTVPWVALVTQASRGLDIIARNDPGHETSGNVTVIDEFNASNYNTFIIVLAVEIVFIVLFAVTLWYGVNH